MSDDGRILSQEDLGLSSMVRRFLAAPIFPDEKTTGTARIVRIVLFITIITNLLGFLTVPPSVSPLQTTIVLIAMLVVELIAFGLMKLRRLYASASILTAGIWLILAVAAIFGEGITNAPYLVLIITVVLAGLLISGKAGFVFALLNAVLGFVLLILDLNHLLPAPLLPFSLPAFYISNTVITLLIAGLIYMTAMNLRETAEKAQISEQKQKAMNLELQQVRDSLEARVAESNLALEIRSKYLTASIEVSRAANSILDPHQLIQETVELIREQFGLYYVGIFLIDPTNEWAVLQAGTGEAGRAMLQRGHRIRLGSGMVGWSIANAQARIALEAKEDTHRLAIPELPETRSEAAIPMRSRGKVLGAITVQSDQTDAFGEIEISAFQAMADQLATSLENARLYQDTQKALLEAQRFTQEASRIAWQELIQSGEELAYRYQNKSVAPTKNLWTPDMRQALMSGKSATVLDKNRSALLVPISIRDQHIGIINLHKEDQDHEWTEQEVRFIEAISQQLGVILESARLYQDTQRLAYRERMASEVSSRIRQTLDVETVLRTAIQEIQRTLGVNEVVVSLKPPEKVIPTNNNSSEVVQVRQQESRKGSP